MIIELYRGLMNILIEQNLQFENKLVALIRPFHEPKEPEPGESGIFNGFWNFMLEVSMILFAKFIFVMGIILVLTLAIIFFPLNFLVSISAFAAKDGDRQLLQTQQENEPKIEPKMDKEKK